MSKAILLEMIIIIIISYLGFAFVINEFNFQNWFPSERGGLLFCSGAFILFANIKRINP
jgi:hypothetical protein